MIHATTTATIDRPGTPAAPRRRRHLGGRRAGIALALTLAAVGAGAGGLASPASAYDIGGCTWGSCPGDTVQVPVKPELVDVDCSPGRITISPMASAMSGFANGQYISYRYALVANTGYRTTSGWSAVTLAPATAWINGATYATPLTPLPKSVVSVTPGFRWTVSVQFARWNGSAWSSFTGWILPEGYSQGGTQRWYTNCLP